ncbi:hypothetical protein [Paenibacillus catalpae]|uniref:hypothetical protein n=1 Tax=Paenibacillus catalpae TaxID=1045775 RepID=UPI000AFAFF0C|nr:hypothetical protein [Paenibacillus catalpae]
MLSSYLVNYFHQLKTEIGGQYVEIDAAEGSKTSVMLASLPADGPTGQFFFMNNQLP